MSELKMDIPLPDDPPPEESSLHDIPVPDEPIRYSPSLAVEEDPISPLAIPTTSINESTAFLPSVLGKSAAKKRLLAFSLAKQNVKKMKNDIKSMEASTPTINSSKDGDHIRSKKKRKKGVLDKARDVISEIEEIKRQENIQQQRENMQLLHPRWNRNNSRSCSGPISIPDLEEDDTYKIDTLVEKILAKEARKERSEREKEAEKRERRERREKEKLVPKSWEEFNRAGFIAYHYRRFKFRREKISRSSKRRSSRSRSDGEETDSAGKKKYNLLETPMVLKVPLTVVGVDDDYKDFPSWSIRYTYTRPNISYSINPVQARSMLLSRNEMMKTLTDDIKEIIEKFLEMKPTESTEEEPIYNRSWYSTENFMLSNVKEVTNPGFNLTSGYNNLGVKTVLEYYSTEETSDKEEYSYNIREQLEFKDGKGSIEKEQDVGEEVKPERIIRKRHLENPEKEIKNYLKDFPLVEYDFEEPVLDGSKEDETSIRPLNENVEYNDNLNTANEGMLASEYEQFMKTIEERESERILGNQEELKRVNTLSVVEDDEDEWFRTTSLDRNPENTSCIGEKLKRSSNNSSKNKSCIQDSLVKAKKKKMLVKKRKRKRSDSSSSDSSTSSTSSSSSSSTSSSCSSSSSSSISSTSSSSSSSSSTSSSSNDDSSSDSSSSSSSSIDSFSSAGSHSTSKKKRMKLKMKKKELLDKKRKQKLKTSKKALLTKNKNKKLKNGLEKKKRKLSPSLKVKNEKKKETDITDIKIEKERHKHNKHSLNSTDDFYFTKINLGIQDNSQYSIQSGVCHKRSPINVPASADSSSGMTFNKANKRSKPDISIGDNSLINSECRPRPQTKRHFNLDIFQDEKSSNSNSEYFSPLIGGRQRLIDYDFSSDDSQFEDNVATTKDKVTGNSTSLVQGTDESCEKSSEIYSPTAVDYDEDDEEEIRKVKQVDNASTANSSHIDESSQLVSFGVNSASQEARMLDIPLPPPKQTATSPTSSTANLTTSFHNILQQSPSSASFSPQRKVEEKKESPIHVGKSGARLTFGKQMTKLKPLNIFSGEDSDSETAHDKVPTILEKGLSPMDKSESNKQSKGLKLSKLSPIEKLKTEDTFSEKINETVRENTIASPLEKKSRWDISELPSNANKIIVQDAAPSTRKCDNADGKDISGNNENTSDPSTSYLGWNRSRSESSERRSKLLYEENRFREKDRRYSKERKSSREKRRSSRGRERSRDRRRRHGNERKRSSDRSSQYKCRSGSPRRSKLSPFSSKLKLHDSRSKLNSPSYHPYGYLPDKYQCENYNVDIAYHKSDDNDIRNSPFDSQDKNYNSNKPSDNASFDSPLSRKSHNQRSSLPRENHGKRQRSPSFDESPNRHSPEYEKDSSYYRSKGSPSRRRLSPDRWSPVDYKRNSPSRRRSSPDRKWNYSPYRWESPNRRNPSPVRSRRSPPFRRYSPDRMHNEGYNENSCYGRRSMTPPMRRSLSPQKRMSPSFLSEEARRDGNSRFTNSPVRHLSPSTNNPSGDTSNEWKWNYPTNMQSESNFSNSSNNRSEFATQNKKFVGYNQQSEINDYQMSLADSTISDSELIKDVSPKRLSLDERLQLELGDSDANLPKNNSSNYSNYYYQNNEAVTYYNHQIQYPKSSITSSNLIRPPTVAVDWNVPKPHPSTSQVLQVGNMLQVVPSEISTMSTSYPPKPNSVPNASIAPKIVQVGNVLQVVPRPEEVVDTSKQQSESVPNIPPPNILAPEDLQLQQQLLKQTQQPPPPPPPIPSQSTQPQPNITCFHPVPPPGPLGTALTPAQIVAAPPPPPPLTTNAIIVSAGYTTAAVPAPLQAETILPQTIQGVPQPNIIPTALAAPAAESPARLLKLEEKERRRKAKELRRRKKEQKIAKKLKMLRMKAAAAAAAAVEEASSALESLKSCDTLHVAPVPLPSPEKGILISSGFRDTPPSGSESRKVKSVSFADGIRPGYGSSPSGGEEHPLSPPPIVRKKTKKKKRRKVKVRIVRIEGNTSKNDDDEEDDEEEEEEEDEEDDLSPPPPPPGTPPPEAYYDFTTAGGFIYPQPFTMAPSVSTDEKLQPHVAALPITVMPGAPVINYSAPPPPPPPPVNTTTVLR